MRFHRLIHATGALLLFAALASPGQSGAIIQQFFAPDAVQFQGFGHAAEASGDRAIIGAIGDETSGPLTGAAYVAVRGGDGQWHIEAKLLPQPAQAFGVFGAAVAIDGDRAIVGAPQAGRAFVYRRLGPGQWVQDAALTAPAMPGPVLRFGSTVAISGDDALVASEVDEIQEMWLFAFRRIAGQWQFVQAIQPLNDPSLGIGSSLALAGNQLVVGNTWFQQGALTSSGVAYVFEKSEAGVWVQQARLLPGDPQELAFFGSDVAFDGDRVVVGASGYDSLAGRIYVFERQPAGNWLQTAQLSDPESNTNGSLGSEIAFDGTRLAATVNTSPVIGEESAVRVWTPDAQGGWLLRESIAAPANTFLFGVSAALSGGQVLIGASANLGSVFDAGAIFVVRLGACGSIGDVNGDGNSSDSDLGVLLAEFGCQPPAECLADLNGDQRTDDSDLGILLAGFGETCQ